MIPKRRPPFGVGRVISSILSYSDGITVDRVEQAYAQTYGMPYAVLLPSCRAGICWALKAVISRDTPVLCPVYTCAVVREAVIRSGGRLHLIDVQKDGFLMDEAALKSAQVGNYALVLCEIYGYTYDLSQITQQATTTSAIRIVDMAMTVPIREHFERLENSDFAVISFGAGKCMYAGWGGMGFTRDKVLADKVREMRESSVSSCTLLLLFKRSLRMIAKNLFNAPIAYGFLKRMIDAKRSMRRSSAPHSSVSTIYSIAQQPASKQWYLPTTYVDRSLMLYNLEHIDQYCEHKKTLARRYHDNFYGVPGVIRPDTSLYALSHYPIRVASGIRPLLKKYLSKAGIDVGTLYFFPTSLSKSDYPNASRITSEVLDLPLYMRLSLDDVDWICESIACAIEFLNKAST